MLRSNLTVAALPEALLPHAGDIFAARSSLAAVMAAVARPGAMERIIEGTTSGRQACLNTLFHPASQHPPPPGNHP